jgi:hypothetical protein
MEGRPGFGTQNSELRTQESGVRSPELDDEESDALSSVPPNESSWRTLQFAPGPGTS